jgi:hypothetical protein
VCFVDLAVNNRDPKITENFVFEWYYKYYWMYRIMPFLGRK